MTAIYASRLETRDRDRASTVDYKDERTERPVVQVECVFFGPFREDVGVKHVARETEAESVGDLLSELEADFPVLSGRLLEDEGLAGETVVTKNKTDIRHLEGLETALEEGDVFRMVPSVYGG